MRWMLLIAAIGIAGCRQSVTVELTPLEEYALALQVFETELRLLENFEKAADADNPKDAEYLATQRANLQLAKDRLQSAEARWKKDGNH